MDLHTRHDVASVQVHRAVAPEVAHASTSTHKIATSANDAFEGFASGGVCTRGATSLFVSGIEQSVDLYRSPSGL